jgi:DNA-binding transcriptional MerR regulator
MPAGYRNRFGQLTRPLTLTLRDGLALAVMSAKTFTVSQVSRLAHVTVRTLHHYDEIGLLVPSQRTDKGYRLYTEADLQRLQQVLLFKELGFALDAIASLIDEPAAERRAALLNQREKLRVERRKTEAVLRAIETAIHALEGDDTMDEKKMFDGFAEFEHARIGATGQTLQQG